MASLGLSPWFLSSAIFNPGNILRALCIGGIGGTPRDTQAQRVNPVCCMRCTPNMVSSYPHACSCPASLKDLMSPYSLPSLPYPHICPSITFFFTRNCIICNTGYNIWGVSVLRACCQPRIPQVFGVVKGRGHCSYMVTLSGERAEA